MEIVNTMKNNQKENIDEHTENKNNDAFGEEKEEQNGDNNSFKAIYQDRKSITAALSLSLQKKLNPKNDTRIYIAKEVTFDYATGHAVRVDYVQFKPLNNSVSGIEKGDFYCYEIKSSVEDFHSKNGHNFIGDFNYYVMPAEVYESIATEIPYFVGVLVPEGKSGKGDWYDLTIVKKARRRDRNKPLHEMLFMMFRSCARDMWRKKA